MLNEVIIAEMVIFLLQVTVVEETIRYIDELHKALAVKLQSKTGLTYHNRNRYDNHLLVDFCRCRRNYIITPATCWLGSCFDLRLFVCLFVFVGAQLKKLWTDVHEISRLDSFEQQKCLLNFGSLELRLGLGLGLVHCSGVYILPSAVMSSSYYYESSSYTVTI